jgi:hypothetical protein
VLQRDKPARQVDRRYRCAVHSRFVMSAESLALSAVEWVEKSLTALQTSTDNIERFLDSARNDSS